MLSYSQRDPSWSNAVMLPSTLTLGRYGCLITSIADLSTYFGDNCNPRQTLNHVKLTKDGLVLWNTISFDTFAFERRAYTAEHSEIARAIQDPNTAVLLEVARHSHWCVAIGLALVGGLYRIADPWLGDRATTKRYGDDITGCAFFKRK